MAANETSMADALRSAIFDAQELVRGELALARAELREEMKRIRAGLVALVVAAFGILMGIVLLLTAASWLISEALGWPAWTGFALVGGAMTLLAVILAVVGRGRLASERRMPLTMDTLKENMRWMRARTS